MVHGPFCFRGVDGCTRMLDTVSGPHGAPTLPAILPTTNGMSPVDLAVETVALSKRYNDYVAVSDLTIRVQRGEVFGFLGPNGAGKTTSIKMLMGLVRPSSGTARLLGRPLGDRDAKGRIGFLPELFRFHDWLTGEEFLDLHGKLYGMRAADRRRAIPEVLNLVGLYDRRSDRLRSYSKGMQQRIGLAQALINDPLVVFLDEPTSALDPIGRQEVRGIIESLRKQGRTVFLNSHLLSEVEAVCDRVAIISRGRVAAMGTMTELLGNELVIELRIGRWDEGVDHLVREFCSIEEYRELGDERVIVVVAAADETVVSRLVDALVERRVPVYGVTPKTMTLEELFFDVVGRSAGTER
jgi:ABC-2 type transport system ATP-binding protein